MASKPTWRGGKGFCVWGVTGNRLEVNLKIEGEGGCMEAGGCDGGLAGCQTTGGVVEVLQAPRLPYTPQA